MIHLTSCQRGPSAARVIADSIKSLTCREFGVLPRQIEGKNRQEPIVLARHVAMYLTRELAQWSLPRIGQHYGNRDHTTVLHAIIRVPERCRFDPALIDRIERIEIALLRGEK